MTKAAVAYSISQLGLEEPEITSVGVAPGLCDTKMVQDLIKGQCKCSTSLPSKIGGLNRANTHG